MLLATVKLAITITGSRHSEGFAGTGCAIAARPLRAPQVQIHRLMDSTWLANNPPYWTQLSASQDQLIEAVASTP